MRQAVARAALALVLVLLGIDVACVRSIVTQQPEVMTEAQEREYEQRMNEGDWRGAARLLDGKRSRVWQPKGIAAENEFARIEARLNDLRMQYKNQAIAEWQEGKEFMRVGQCGLAAHLFEAAAELGRGVIEPADTVAVEIELDRVQAYLALLRCDDAREVLSATENHVFAGDRRSNSLRDRALALRTDLERMCPLR